MGFVGWLGRGVSEMLVGQSPLIVMVALVVLFFVMHYMFASITAHTMAVFPVFYAVGTAAPGVSPVTFGLLLGFTLGIMGILTPYATGPAPGVLWKWIHWPPRILEARPHLRRDLSGGSAADRRANADRGMMDIDVQWSESVAISG